jgi:hypothetical protein
MSETSSTVEVYLGPSKGWSAAPDYQRSAYLDFKLKSVQLLQMYYVDNGLLNSNSEMIGEIHPGIKKIEKKDAAAEETLRFRNVIFTMKREHMRDNSRKYYMYYMITEDDIHVPITDDPELKVLQEEEEILKKNLNNEIKKTRVKWVKTKQQSVINPDGDADVGTADVGTADVGGKRKTKQKRTNKNKRYTRQTRRYFKR